MSEHLNRNRTVSEPASVRAARNVHDESLSAKQATNERIASLHKAGGGPDVTVSPARSPTPQGFKVNIPG